mgnify:CR=1 FL=1
MKPLRLVVCLLGLCGPGVAGADDGAWTLEAADWARPRDGAALTAMQPLPRVVAAWGRTPDARLIVRYAGGEAGEIWAAELTDWLVALGVPGDAIVTVPGAAPERLELEVEPGGNP